MRRVFMNTSVRCAAFLMAYYIANSVFQSYISLFYTDRGMDNTQIGLINSLIALVSVFTMQFWGAVGDRAKSRNWLLFFMAVVSAALMLLVKLPGGFPYILVMICLFASFYTSLQPMGDSIVLASLARENRRFGPVRMAGGLSFAVMAMVFGRVMDGVKNSEIVIYAVSALCALVALSALYLPKVAGAGRRGEKGRMLTLFKSRDLTMLFLLMIPLQITLGYFYAFFSPLFKYDLPGGNETLLGWCYFISAASEVPFLLNSDRLFEKYGAGRLMCGSALTLGLRWLLVATTKSAYLAMASQLLHFWGFIVITVTLSKYIHATVPDNLKASGQLLISVFGFGVARVIGYFGGGVLSDAIGRQSVFYFCSAICILCFLVFTPYYFRRPPLNGKAPCARING